MEWTRLTLIVEAEWADAVSEYCVRLGAAGTWVEDDTGSGRWFVHAFYPAAGPPEGLSKMLTDLAGAGIDTRWSTVAVDDEEWRDSWKRFWRRMNVGRRLLVIPAWDTGPVPPDRIPIRIDPGMAFGTGQHATTVLMLEALEDELPGGRVLDLGTGSAILAVAAQKLGAGSVMAVDSDPVAVAAARTNTRDVEGVAVVQGDARAVPVEEQFNLILSNLTADLICDLAPVLPRYLSRSGRWLASGIIRGREHEVSAALTEAGWRQCDRRIREEWVLIIVDRADSV